MKRNDSRNCRYFIRDRVVWQVHRGVARNFPEVGTVFQIIPNLPKCFHTGDDFIEFSLFINMEREDMI